MGLTFSKYHGSGNDFLLVYGQEVTADLAVELCRRNTGVGADGLIVLGPSGRAEFAFKLFNADGSVAEVSGNGLRCVGKFLFEKGHTSSTSIKVEAAGEIKVLDLTLADDAVAGVKVDMGIADDLGDIHLFERKWRRVDTGNPHLVTMVDDVDEAPVTELGPRVEHHPDFPERINAHFIRVRDDVIEARFWERGVGETLACGTGSCAALVAAGLDRATVRSRGGEVGVERDGSGRISLTGPAVHVFDGETP